MTAADKRNGRPIFRVVGITLFAAGALLVVIFGPRWMIGVEMILLSVFLLLLRRME